jgi:hypothetical protein
LLFGWQCLDRVLDLSDVHTFIVPRWTWLDAVTVSQPHLDVTPKPRISCSHAPQVRDLGSLEPNIAHDWAALCVALAGRYLNAHDGENDDR